MWLLFRDWTFSYYLHSSSFPQLRMVVVFSVLRQFATTAPFVSPNHSLGMMTIKIKKKKASFRTHENLEIKRT